LDRLQATAKPFGADLLGASRLRPIRFAVVGGICGLTQLTALAILLHTAIHPVIANVFGFALSAELNFVLSQTFTWRDRHLRDAHDTIARRWLTFHLCIGGTAGLNMAVFAGLRLELPDLLAAAAGILAAAILNFFANDRLTFRPEGRSKGDPRD